MTLHGFTVELTADDKRAGAGGGSLDKMSPTQATLRLSAIFHDWLEKHADADEITIKIKVS